MDVQVPIQKYNQENIVWNIDDVEKEKLLAKKPTPYFSMVGENVRQLIPESSMCSMFCGGSNCKYCNPIDRWPETAYSIKGLYSSWITDNILAMSRPSTKIIKDYDVINQFKTAGIKTVINVQKPFEHSTCGDGLEADGFSYNPYDFMNNDIYFYNFSCQDYGTASLAALLDMVRVMQFALHEGKVAIHCHAGLGRTGILIACYLIFNNRLSGAESIHYVRTRRKGCLQTESQVNICLDFYEYLRPYRCTFWTPVCSQARFNLAEYLRRQRLMLHGMESRKLRYFPRLLYVLLQRMLIMVGRYGKSTSISLSKSEMAKERCISLAEAIPNAFNLSKNVDETSKKVNLWIADLPHCSPDESSIPNKSGTISLADEIRKTSDSHQCIALATAIAFPSKESSILESCESWKNRLNQSDEALHQLANDDVILDVLARLFMDWLNHLKSPVICIQSMEQLLKMFHCETGKEQVEQIEKEMICKVGRASSTLLLEIVRFVARLQPLPEDTEEALITSLLGALTQQQIFSTSRMQQANCEDSSSLEMGDSASLSNFSITSGFNSSIMSLKRSQGLLKIFNFLLDCEMTRTS